MSTRAARCLQGGQLDAAAVRIRAAASVASCQQPVNRADVQRQFVGLALTGTAVGRQVDLHHVAFSGESHPDRRRGSTTSTNSHPTRRRQRHAQRVQQRGRLDPYGLNGIGDDDGEKHVPILRMMLEQRQRLAYTVARQQGFEIGVAASRQLPQLRQQPLQAVGIGAQAGEHALVGYTRRVDERGDRRDRRHSIAERVCQPAKQIVMYREPARRTGVAAHV